VAGLRDDGLGYLDLAIEDIARNFQVHRSRGAVECLARGHRDHVRDALGARYRGGELGDRRHEIDVRQVLERSHLVLRQRALPADMQHRALGAKGGGNPRHGIGAAGPGGGDHATELAGLSRVTVRGVSCDLFVAHVDDADPFIDAAIVNVDDVPAAQGEDRIDAFVLERLGDQMPAGNDAGVTGLSLERVFRGRRTLAVRSLGRRRLEHGSSIRNTCLRQQGFAWFRNGLGRSSGAWPEERHLQASARRQLRRGIDGRGPIRVRAAQGLQDQNRHQRRHDVEHRRRHEYRMPVSFGRNDTG